MDFKWQLGYDVNRVCARRPCWRSKTIKLFSFGKKFNSHAKIFLLFTPPTWPPRADSIETFRFEEENDYGNEILL